MLIVLYLECGNLLKWPLNHLLESLSCGHQMGTHSWMLPHVRSKVGTGIGAGQALPASAPTSPGSRGLSPRKGLSQPQP